MTKNSVNSVAGRAPIALMLVAALAIRLWISLRDIPFLIGRFLSDDAFYYFAISRNIAGCMGATFDGILSTNGFHPLYALLIVPLFRFFGENPDTPVHCALIMLSALDCVTGYLIYRILICISDRRAAIIGSCFWLLNPCIFLVTFTGTETALAAACAAWVIFLFARCARAGKLSLSRLALLGFASGLAFLARSDSIFLIMAVIAALFWHTRRTPGRGVLAAACILAVAAITSSPWLIWNINHFGTIRQVSGAVKPYIQRLLFLKGGGAYDGAHLAPKLLSNMKDAFVMAATSSGVRVPGFTALLICIGSALLYSKERQSRNARTVIAVTLIYAASILLFYGLYFWHIQSWYFHGMLMAISIALGWAASFWFGRLGTRGGKTWAIALAAVMAVTIMNGYRHWRIGFYPWQQTYYQLARELGGRFKGQDRFAAFNAGIYGYYASVPLINMDGLVNNAAFDAMKHRTLFADFLRDQGIRYVMDHEYIVRMYWGLFGTGRMEDRLKPVEAIVLPWAFSDKSSARIVIYEVIDNPSGPRRDADRNSRRIHRAYGLTSPASGWGNSASIITSAPS